MVTVKPFDVDVPVALIFFARPDVLAVTFSAIKAARPSKLFLIQDGAREGRNDDIENVKKCRQIVKDIDWQCEVRTNYSEKNLGCGMRVYSGVSWAFEYVDRLAIIEDDCVPCKSFFRFTSEILERFKNDERMDMISGMNHLEIYDQTPFDYFFSTNASIWGWATWKRVWKTVDYDMQYLDALDAKRLVCSNYGDRAWKISRLKNEKLKRGEKISSWSTQRGMNMYLQSRLIIVPKYNLVTNIGLSENSANSVSSIKLTPRGKRRVWNLKTHEFEFPLKHPKYVVNDVEYRNHVNRIMAVGHPWIRLYRKCESKIRRLLFRDYRRLLKSNKLP